MKTFSRLNDLVQLTPLVDGKPSNPHIGILRREGSGCNKNIVTDYEAPSPPRLSEIISREEDLVPKFIRII